VGFLMGLLRLAVDTPVALKMEGFENGWIEGSFPWIVNHIYFQYYSLLIFLVSIAAMVIVSYVTPAPSEERLKGLTFGTLTDEHRRESRASWSAADVIASGVVMAAIIAAYVYFRG
jgi:SSS family solute:Na+ symporter